MSHAAGSRAQVGLPVERQRASHHCRTVLRRRHQLQRAEYAAKDGYRQALSEQNASDLDAGEKTLAYFVFNDSSFGGKLHIPFYDEDGTSDGDWELDLTIK